MKKLTVILLLFAAPLYATIAQISHTSQGSSDGIAVTSGAISTTGASLITIQVVSIIGVAEPALTESTGNITFSACGSLQATTNDTRIHSYYWAVTNANQTSGTHTFTATQTASYPTIFVQSWSGTHATPCDQNTGAANDSAVTLATGSITPMFDNELVITAIGVDSADAAFTVNGGFTEQDEWTLSSNNFGGSMAYLIQTTGTAANPTWDNHTTGKSMATTIASFKAAASDLTIPSTRRRRRN